MLWGESKNRKNASSSVQARFNLFDLNTPLISLHPDYLLYAFLVALSAFVLILGSHIGNYLAYSYELVVPTFLFWFFVIFDQKRTFTTFSALLIVINLFYW